MKLKTISSLLFSLVIATTAVAEEYNLHISDLNDCTNSFGGNLVVEDADNLGVNINYIDLKYNDTTNEFTIEVNTDDTGESGNVANSFYFGLNGGGMPQKGEIAFVYFDAEDPSAPKATVYGYNGYAGFQKDINGDLVRFDQCNNTKILETDAIENGGSWYHGYPVLPGDIEKDSPFNGSILEQGPSLGAELILANDSTDITATATPNTAGQSSYTYTLVLDTTNINLHDSSVINFLKANHPTPSSVNDYRGLSFADNLGLWFWAASDADFTYNVNNFIDTLDTETTGSACVVCDEGAFDTKVAPKCNGTAATQSPVEVGTQTILTINVQDEDLGEANNGATTVSYSGLPTDAKVTPAEGAEVVFDASGNGSVVIDWIPELADVGTHTISAVFTKPYGNGELTSENCPIEIEVTTPTPECNESEIAIITQADQDLGHLTGLSTSLRIKTNRLRKAIGNIKPVDDFNEEEEFETVGWAAYNNIIANGKYLYECNNAEFCTEGIQTESLATDLSDFNSSLNTIHTNAVERAEKFRKAKRKYFIKIKGYAKRRATKRAKRITNRLLNGSLGGVNPTAKSAQENVDAHIDSYGLLRFTCSNAK